MSFEEAQPEIALAFENANLAAAMRSISRQLVERAEFVRVAVAVRLSHPAARLLRVDFLLIRRE
jgi:hypothetical protein